MIAIIVTAIVIILLLWIVALFGTSDWNASSKKMIIGVLVVFTIVVAIGTFWFSTTAAGRRALKTTQSNLTGGLPRKVEVYSMDGKLIKEYQGKFDIDYDENRIIFDDEKGKRHVIYYPTGTITVDELEE